MRNSDLFKQMQPEILRMLKDMGIVSAQGKGFSYSPHTLGGSDHVGQLSDAQAPQFLMRDGSRSLLANLAVASGVTVDGVDISQLSSDYSGHLSADSHTMYFRADGTRNMSGNILPASTDTYDIGSSTLLWRKGYLSELDTILFAQTTATLFGGWAIIGHGEGTLPLGIKNDDTSVEFGQTMTPNDFVLLRGLGQVEYLQVGTLVSGTVYNVTRNLDGSGANNWPAGFAYLILGHSGDGRIELNAYDTPRIQLLLQGAAYNSQTEVVRIGDLNGWGGGSTELYGVAIGDYSSGNYLRYDGTGGFVLHAGDDAVSITDSGIRIIAPSSGTPAIPNSVDFVSGSDPVASLVGYYSSVGKASGLNLISRLPSTLTTDGEASIAITADAQTGATDNTRAAATLKAQSKQVTTGTNVSSYLAAFAEKDGTAPIRLYTFEADGGYANLYFKKTGLEISRSGSTLPTIKIANDYLHGTDGWASAGETWTYASAATFTISGDVRAKYPIGTKIKLTQSSTVKYFYVVSTSYGSPNTTVTITGGSDYSLANTTISANYLSYVETPQAFPIYFNWTPTLTGFSVDPGSSVYRFAISGTRFEGVIHQGTDGTSNDTVLNISIPVTAKAGSSWQGASGYAVNGGTALTAASRWYIGGGNNYIQFVSNMASGTWSNTGGKRVRAIVSCEIG